MSARSAQPPDDFDFLDYAARNLSDAYRLVLMALEDPIRAQDVVHESIMSAWLSAGGGSDGNFTAALGVPTLDGLGAIGDGAHAAHEHVDVTALPWRAALVAGLLARLE